MENYRALDNGDYIETSTNKIIKAPIDIGHAHGFEHRRLKIAATEIGLTQKQFNDYINAHPEYFRLENMHRNRGHYDEKPGIGDINEIKRNMNIFLKEERQ